MLEVNADSFGRYPSTGPWEHPACLLHEFSEKRSEYCLLIFVLNENERLHVQLEKMQPLFGTVDVVIADGGSTDGGVDIDKLKGYGLRALLVKKGPGRLGAQMRMGFAYALQQGYKGILTVDGNNKDGVTEGVPRFIEKLEGKFDYVQGSRFIPGGYHENTPLSRHIAVMLIHAPVLSLAARFRYTDTTNGFRGYSSEFLREESVGVFRNILSGYEMHYYLAVESARRGYKVCEVPVSRVYPREGKVPTKISPLKGNLKVLREVFKVAFGHYRLPG